jgi:hypothetical protein
MCVSNLQHHHLKDGHDRSTLCLYRNTAIETERLGIVPPLADDVLFIARRSAAVLPRL